MNNVKLNTSQLHRGSEADIALERGNLLRQIFGSITILLC